MNRRAFISFFSFFLCSLKANAISSLVSVQNLFFPNDPLFSDLKKIVNPALELEDPTAILQSNSLPEIQSVMQVCALNPHPVRIRSGGHSFEGFSMGKGVVIDVRKFKQLIMESNYIKAGSGLTLEELMLGLEPHGYTFPSGSCPTVGISGFLLGGGHGLKSRYLGLGADRVQSMEVLTASGSPLFVSPKVHGDLYWSLLGGGGGNFAIVKEFHLDLINRHDDLFFSYNFSPEHIIQLFLFWENWISQCKNNVSPNFVIYFKSGKIQNIQIFGLINNSSELEVFNEEPWLFLKSMSVSPPIIRSRSSNYVRPKTPILPFKGTSQYSVNPLGETGIKKLLETTSHFSESSKIQLVFEPMGGAIKNFSANGYPHRDTIYILEIHSSWVKAQDKSKHQNAVNNIRRHSDELFSKKSYVNYCDYSLSEDWAERYYGRSLSKLVDVKKKYDPQNIFDFGDHSLSSYIKTIRD